MVSSSALATAVHAHSMSATALDIQGWAIANLGHTFINQALLIAAVTHTSLNQSGINTNYERLEFLGDRVLGVVVADFLYLHYPEEGEGKMARRLAELVRRESCATVARAIGAERYVRMERTAQAAKVHESDGTLGDVCEALIGALYLDGGMDVASQFIKKHWAPLMNVAEMVPKDAKSALQEWAQGRGLPLPIYTVKGQSGPDHAPVFDIEVNVRGYPPELASGTNKQEAQKKAAIQLLTRLSI